MRCLRCGHCCHKYAVIIVDDPDKPISEDNLTAHMGDGPCKHLRGDTPGAYACSIHAKPWYNQTPCFSHGQVEYSPDDNCRLGEYILKRKEK
jgi:hypothetical protein